VSQGAIIIVDLLDLQSCVCCLLWLSESQKYVQLFNSTLFVFSSSADRLKRFVRQQSLDVFVYVSGSSASAQLEAMAELLKQGACRLRTSGGTSHRLLNAPEALDEL
jgi:hypothetical protein